MLNNITLPTGTEHQFMEFDLNAKQYNGGYSFRKLL